jgi:uncharacterized protein
LENNTESIGTVSAIWRYPVKSMQGEQISATSITERGLIGDRAYALIEAETGFVVSAKHARKWDTVLQCRAAFIKEPQISDPLPPIAITRPDGEVVRSDDPTVDERLSQICGRDVRLVQQVPAGATREANRISVNQLETAEDIRRELSAQASPPGTFFDYAPIHILTTATLERLRQLYPGGDFDVRRFRPNLVITVHIPGEGFVENTWPGKTLLIAPELILRAIDPSPRCVITILPQADLPRDIGILKTVAQHNAAASATLAPGVLLSAVVGIYATAHIAGSVIEGAPMRIV